jgi:serine/threonine-protein kinase
MSYVAGESLQKRIDRTGALELRDILRIGMQAARGLSAAHEQGLVHRDVKPANILLENDVDRVLLTDFGLARAVDDASLTLSGVIAGTPQYMSPEQARGEGIDTRADLFGLGAVLYTMCTGRAPFRAETTMGILHKICSAAPHPVRDLNADIPLWLEQIIERLLAKSPADRYQTAAEVAELLGQCLAHVQHPTANRLPESLRVARRAKRTWRRAAAATALAAVLLVGGLALRMPWRGSASDNTTGAAPGSTATTTDPTADVRPASPQIDIPSATSIEQQLLDIEQSLEQILFEVSPPP